MTDDEILERCLKRISAVTEASAIYYATKNIGDGFTIIPNLDGDVGSYLCREGFAVHYFKEKHAEKLSKALSVKLEELNAKYMEDL